MKSSKKLLTFLSLAVILASLLTACSGTMPKSSGAATTVPVVSSGGKLNVEGRVMPKTYTQLAFAVNGPIDSLPVAEGAQVAKGDVLMTIGNRQQADAALAAARLEALNAQQALDRLQRKADLSAKEAHEALVQSEKALVDAQKAYADVDTDEYKNTLDDKETALQNAKDKLKDAKEELDKRLNLDVDNQVRKDAQTAVDNAQRDVDSAQRDLDLWKNKKDDALANLALAESRVADDQKEVDNRANGADPDELAAAQSRLDNANAAVKAAENTLANYTLSAPFSGTVADLNQLAIGQWVNAGRSAVTLADFSEWYIETKDLTELDVVDISLGQKVSARPDALKDVELNGEVTAIKPVYTERSGDVLYTVRIRINNPDAQLRWGMTVQVTFE